MLSYADSKDSFELKFLVLLKYIYADWLIIYHITTFSKKIETVTQRISGFARPSKFHVTIVSMKTRTKMYWSKILWQ